MTTKKLAITFMIVICGITISCEKETKQERPLFTLEQSDIIDDEDYAVYSLVINEIYSNEQIIISQSSKTSIELSEQNQFYDILIENNPNLDTDLINRLKEVNESSVFFDEKFTSDDKEIKLISAEELSYIFNGQDINSDWEEFYKEYKNSNGIFGFTRIGYNNTKTQAIFETGNTFGSLGGSGSIIYLEKQDNKWIIKDRINTWVS